jgi:hypothetical protein
VSRAAPPGDGNARRRATAADARANVRRAWSIRAITVFCSSSAHVSSVYLDAAADLGGAIARNGWRLIYGGNCVGCMGRLADAARAAGGRVTGVTPQVLVDKGISDTRCDELIVTTGMRERKALMEERGDACLALPGGLGTFEEIFELIVGRHLGLHDKPILFVNIAGYYNPMLGMIDHGIEHKFIKASARDAFRVFETVDEAVEHLRDLATPDAEPL